MRKSYIPIIILALYSCGFIGIADSLSGEKKREQTLMFPLTQQDSEQIIQQTDFVDELYPARGPYQLTELERAELKYMMAARLVAGFNEPAKQKRFAWVTLLSLQMAAEGDNLTMQDIFDKTVANLKTKFARGIPAAALHRERLMAANSIVLSSQALKRPAILEAGLDTETLELAIKNMRKIRRMVIDEINRRELQNG